MLDLPLAEDARCRGLRGRGAEDGFEDMASRRYLPLCMILGGAVEGRPCHSRLEYCGTLEHQWIHLVGLTSLWAAAILTLVTGWDYLRVGLKHMD